MSTKRSRVHPQYQTQDRGGNWPTHEESLVQRGNLNIWMSPDATKNTWEVADSSSASRRK